MKRYILITGGELFNKGAQAMTFVTVSELSKRYPNKQIILVSGRDNSRPQAEKDQYCFEFMDMPNVKIQLMSPILKYFKQDSDTRSGRFLQVIRRTDAIINISGYALGSNWGIKANLTYMFNIFMAYINHIPVYLMPQSFGPFEYSGKMGRFVDTVIKFVLPKAKVVMVREYDGLEWLQKKYPKARVKKAFDLVLQNQHNDIDRVYKIPPIIKQIEVPENSVALIPNAKSIKYSSKEKAYSEYKCFINCLLANNKTVFLIYHAIEDYEICKDLKAMYFKDDDRVIVVNEELSCLDFDENVKKFDFIIGSRFHSIVHAYKNAVPAIVLGWAVKYRELMAIFEQEKYQFDSRKSNSEESMQAAVSNMCQLYSQESRRIGEILKTVQQENVFDEVKL